MNRLSDLKTLKTLKTSLHIYHKYIFCSVITAAENAQVLSSCRHDNKLFSHPQRNMSHYSKRGEKQNVGLRKFRVQEQNFSFQPSKQRSLDTPSLVAWQSPQLSGISFSSKQNRRRSQWTTELPQLFAVHIWGRDLFQWRDTKIACWQSFHSHWQTTRWNDWIHCSRGSFHILMNQGSSLMEEVTVWLEDVILMEGLSDTVTAVFLPRVVVGSLHSVLLAAYTHCAMRVSLDKVQWMKMKPVWRETDEL